MRDNLSEGLRFYMSLQEAIVTLQQQIGDFCLTRRIQRCDSRVSTILCMSCHHCCPREKLVLIHSPSYVSGHRRTHCRAP